MDVDALALVDVDALVGVDSDLERERVHERDQDHGFLAPVFEKLRAAIPSARNPIGFRDVINAQGQRT